MKITALIHQEMLNAKQKIKSVHKTNFKYILVKKLLMLCKLLKNFDNSLFFFTAQICCYQYYCDNIMKI